MASGINSTFRQVGVATGIAALGSMFTAAISGHLAGALPPSLAGSAGSMVSAIRQGSVARLIASVPPADRGAVGSRCGRASPPRSTSCFTSPRASPWSARCAPWCLSAEGLPPVGRRRAGAGRADAD